MGLMKPRFMEEGWHYFDDKEGKWKIKPDAPEWEKKEAEEFYKKVNPEPDENGIIRQY